MQIVDTALAARAAEGRPVRIGLVGAGFMARGIVHQVHHYMPGLRVVAICNRTVVNGLEAYRLAGLTAEHVESKNDLERAVAEGGVAVTSDPEAMCAADCVDVVIESTGHVEYGCRVTMCAIRHGKDVVLMNAELDATVGPMLKVYADKAGVIVTGCDGDQPGVQINLLRFVRSLGLEPLVCGNIKGLQDRYRTPATQASFAAQWGQTAEMVTSFADGTKISFEQAIVANATGMRVAQRGMIGLEHRGHVDEMTSMYDVDAIRAVSPLGIVEYVVGGLPSPGVYVFATCDDPTQRHYLNYGKLGEGPVYSFYVPWHLTIFEVPLSAARVALFRDVVIAPIGAPVVDVITVAKTDLTAGTVLDGLGGFHTYGTCENSETVRSQGLLPMGLAEGCTLRQAVAKDQPITWDDVIAPDDRLAHQLWHEQEAVFFA